MVDQPIMFFLIFIFFVGCTPLCWFQMRKFVSMDGSLLLFHVKATEWNETLQQYRLYIRITRRLSFIKILALPRVIRGCKDSTITAGYQNNCHNSSSSSIPTSKSLFPLRSRHSLLGRTRWWTYYHRVSI